MDETKVTVRMSAEDRRALKLHAVLQGRSVQDLVLELIRTELATGAPQATGMTREEFVADLYARRGVDTSSPEHRAAEGRAKASVRDAGTRSGSTAGNDKRGAA